MEPTTDMNLLEQLEKEDREHAENTPRFSLPSIILMVGVIAACVVIGIAFLSSRETQPQDGAAPDFTITTFEGDTLRLSDLRGKIVILNFWASWCGPCRDEAPFLQSVYEQYADQDVVVLGVTFSDVEADSRAFIQQYQITYPNAPDIGTNITKDLYHIMGVPETFVINRDGTIAQFFMAQVTEANLIPLIEELVAQPA